MTKRRVVVTGVGVVTALGSNLSEIQSAACGGARCYAAVKMDPCEIENLPVPKKERNRIPHVDLLALLATWRAILSSERDPSSYSGATALYIGTTKDLSPLDSLGELLHDHPPDKCNLLGSLVTIATRYATPFALLNSMPNLALHHISRSLMLQGDNSCFLNNGAGGAAAINAGYRAVSSGRAKQALVGGFDSLVNRLSVSRLAALGLLSGSLVTEPGRYRPFEEDRDGLVPSEGSGVLILEDEEQARSRDAKIFGSVRGIGTSNQLYFGGRVSLARTCERAISLALMDAQLQPSDLDFIVANGTGTQCADIEECVGIRSALGDLADSLPVTAFKGLLGHLVSAAAPVEAILILNALSARQVPPLFGCGRLDHRCNLNFVLTQRPSRGNCAMVVSGGLAGQVYATILGGI